MGLHWFRFCLLLLLGLVQVSAQDIADATACFEKLDNCNTNDNALEDFPVLSDDLLKRATKLQDFEKKKHYLQFNVLGAEGEVYKYRIYRCGCTPPRNTGFTTLFTHSNALYVDEHPIIAGMFEIDPDYVVTDYTCEVFFRQVKCL